MRKNITKTFIQRPSHTFKPSLRPERTRCLCSATHSHLGTFGEALGDWEAAPTGQLIPRHYLRGLCGLAVCVQGLRVIWEPLVRTSRNGSLLLMTHWYLGSISEAHRDWNLVQSNLQASKNTRWSLGQLGVCAQWPRTNSHLQWGLLSDSPPEQEATMTWYPPDSKEHRKMPKWESKMQSQPFNPSRPSPRHIELDEFKNHTPEISEMRTTERRK